MEPLFSGKVTSDAGQALDLIGDFQYLQKVTHPTQDNREVFAVEIEGQEISKGGALISGNAAGVCAVS